MACGFTQCSDSNCALLYAPHIPALRKHELYRHAMTLLNLANNSIMLKRELRVEKRERWKFFAFAACLTSKQRKAMAIAGGIEMLNKFYPTD